MQGAVGWNETAVPCRYTQSHLKLTIVIVIFKIFIIRCNMINPIQSQTSSVIRCSKSFTNLKSRQACSSQIVFVKLNQNN